MYGGEDEPWAEEYKFGLMIIGKVCHEHGDEVKHQATVNPVSVQKEESVDSVSIPTVNEVGDNPSSFATKVQRKDTTSQEQLRQMMELDYSELH